MVQRRSDSGCRGKIRISRVFLAILLAAVFVCGEKATNEKKTSVTSASVKPSTAGSDSTTESPTTMSTSVSSKVTAVTTVDDTAKATTLSGQELFARASQCKNLLSNETLSVIVDKCSAIDVVIQRETPLDISQETQENIKKVFLQLQNKIEIDFIISNSSLQILDFGKMKSIGVFKPGRTALKLINNKKLVEIVALEELQFVGNVVVRGNRFLKQSELDKIKTYANRDVQQEKECFQDNENDFTDCERIYGNLVLENYTQKDIPFKPKAISGCLNLKNTKAAMEASLKIEDFLSEFLENDKTDQLADCEGSSYISNYCVKNEIQEKINGKVKEGKKIEFSDKGCKYVCTETDIWTYGQQECTTVEGPLIITDKYNQNQLKLLKSVGTVNGEVTINGTNVTVFSFLNGLMTINSTNPNVPALTIVNNLNATRLGFEITGEIISPAAEKVVFQNNGFNCSDSERKAFERAAHMYVPCGKVEENPPTNPPNTQTDPPNQANQQQANNGNNEKKDTEEESGLGGGAIAGIVIGVLLFVLIALAVAGVLVYFLVYKKRKEKKQDENMEDTKSKTIKSTHKPPEKKENKKPVAPKVDMELQQFIKGLITLIVDKKDIVDKEYDTDEKAPEVKPKEEVMGHDAYMRKFSSALEKFGAVTDTKYFTERFKKNDKLNIRGIEVNLLEETRVELKQFKDEIGKLPVAQGVDVDPDYVHANFVDFKKYGYKQKFIASFCPMKKTESREDTTQRFFAMVFEHNVRVVIDIDTMSEERIYFPKEAGKTVEGEMFSVTTTKVEHNANFIVRTLVITHKASKETRTIPHLELLHWPDQMIPEVDYKGYMSSIFDFVEAEINKDGKKDEKQSEKKEENKEEKDDKKEEKKDEKKSEKKEEKKDDKKEETEKDKKEEKKGEKTEEKEGEKKEDKGDDKNDKNEKTVWIHCRAGIGRTGVLIVCLFIVNAVRTNLKNLEPNFEEWFMHIRKQRYGAIQKPKQYAMLPAMLISMIETMCINQEDQKKITDFLQQHRAA